MSPEMTRDDSTMNDSAGPAQASGSSNARSDSDVDQSGESTFEQSIAFMLMLNTLLRRRWMIVKMTLLLTVVVAGYSLIVAKTFTSVSLFLPSQNHGVANRMTTVVGQASASFDADPAQNTAEYFSAIVKTSSFLGKIVQLPFRIQDTGQEMSLIEYYEIPERPQQERIQLAVEVLVKSVDLKVPKVVGGRVASPIVTLTTTAGEAQLAADINNAILKELSVYSQTVLNSKATHNREYVLLRLTEADIALTGALNVSAEFEGRNRKISTPEVRVMKEQLLRNVRVQEEVFIALTKQLEMARIEEQETRHSFEIIQPAEPPLTRTSPARSRLVGLAGFVGLFLFSGLALLLEHMKRIDEADENFRELRLNLHGIRRDVLRIVTLGLKGRSPVSAGHK